MDEGQERGKGKKPISFMAQPAVPQGGLIIIILILQIIALLIALFFIIWFIRFLITASYHSMHPEKPAFKKGLAYSQLKRKYGRRQGKKILREIQKTLWENHRIK